MRTKKDVHVTLDNENLKEIFGLAQKFVWVFP